MTTTPTITHAEPIALLHEHPDSTKELELYRHGAGCLTDADRKAGWTETRLYSEASLADLQAKANRLAEYVTDLDKAQQTIAELQGENGAIRTMLNATAEGLATATKEKLSAQGEVERLQALVTSSGQERYATCGRLNAENERLRAMMVPQWFYADGYSSEDCNDSPDEVIENMDLKPGHHVIKIDCAGPMPSIWCAVHIRSPEEMDADETDDRASITEHGSQADAQAALNKEPDHGK